MMMFQPFLPVLDGALVLSRELFFYCEMAGVPPHKARHRSRIVQPKDGRKPFIHQYPDPDTAAHEEALAQLAALKMRGKKPTIRPVAVIVYAFKRVPESWSRKDREAALCGRILPTTKPDGDNYLKMIDALKGIVWVDDSVAVDQHVFKRYDSNPRLRIEVTEYVGPT
jgi:Holliday junction resolvase RusA-like endonuclease